MKPDDLLSPAEACAMAGVGPTTLKRWADAGILAHVKTVGGHRRFRRAELQRFLSSRTQLGPTDSPDPNPWIAKLQRGPAHEVEAELLFARSRLGSWHQVAEELGGVLVEVGDRWRRKELSILDEHVISERLARGLARIGEALPSRPGAPRALLACLEGDEHVLGLSLVELCLREVGWTTLWAGPRTPLVELERIFDSLQVDMIALSASAGSNDSATLAHAVEVLGPSCARLGIALALGGEGPWPEDSPHAQRFHDFAGFQAFAADVARKAG